MNHVSLDFHCLTLQKMDRSDEAYYNPSAMSDEEQGDTIPQHLHSRKQGFDALQPKGSRQSSNDPEIKDEFKKAASDIASSVINRISMKPIPQRPSALSTLTKSNLSDKNENRGSNLSLQKQAEQNEFSGKKLQIKSVIVSAGCSEI